MTLAEMQFVLPDLRLASAEIFLLAMTCLIMIVDLFVKDMKRTVTFALTQLTLLGAALITVSLSSGEVAYTFSNMYVSDLLADVLKLLLYITVMVVLSYSRGYVLDRPQMARSEYYTLALFATLGMMVMISANHFLTVYIGIPDMTYGLHNALEDVLQNAHDLAVRNAMLCGDVLNANQLRCSGLFPDTPHQLLDHPVDVFDSEFAGHEYGALVALVAAQATGLDKPLEEILRDVQTLTGFRRGEIARSISGNLVER